MKLRQGEKEETIKERGDYRGVRIKEARKRGFLVVSTVSLLREVSRLEGERSERARRGLEESIRTAV